jgi:hypothetical protein
MAGGAMVRGDGHIRYWFSVSDAEQEFRFQLRIHDPLKRWKLSPMDLQARIVSDDTHGLAAGWVGRPPPPACSTILLIIMWGGVPLHAHTALGGLHHGEGKDPAAHALGDRALAHHPGR